MSQVACEIPAGGSICGLCARRAGATWPEGHQATFWKGCCDGCFKVTVVCDVGDWSWPDGKRRGMRDRNMGSGNAFFDADKRQQFRDLEGDWDRNHPDEVPRLNDDEFEDEEDEE